MRGNVIILSNYSVFKINMLNCLAILPRVCSVVFVVIKSMCVYFPDRSIIKKRTDFEYRLQKRIPEKPDFLRYIQVSRDTVHLVFLYIFRCHHYDCIIITIITVITIIITITTIIIINIITIIAIIINIIITINYNELQQLITHKLVSNLAHCFC